MSTHPAYQFLKPKTDGILPLVFDSPHSGTEFPDDFKTDNSQQDLKTAWDAFIEDLWLPSVDQGASLLAANFPRVYIDPNRAPDDIDPEILAAQWPGAKPTAFSDRGMGLIRRFILPGKPLYTAPLSVAEVQNRLDHYYTPYHNALKNNLDQLYQQFGAVWHIDCHSMKSKGNAMNIDNGLPRPDVILGDLDGTSAEVGFTRVVEKAFQGLGYSVVRNDPYKGGYVVKEYGHPTDNRHSIQIELNRRLYMDEAHFLPHENYDQFKKHLAIVSLAIADYVRARLK